MELRPIMSNKRGQIPTFFVVIASIVAVGIVLFFLNHLFNSIYTELDDYFETSDYNDSLAHTKLTEYQVATNAAWDFAFLGIALGYVLLLGLTAFTTRIHPMFFWVFVFISLFGILVGVLLSNVWQEIVEQPEFSETILRFPITNALLGTFYPTFAVVILAIFLIVLFGKPPGGQG